MSPSGAFPPVRDRQSDPMTVLISRKLPLLILFLILISGRSWQGSVPAGALSVLLLLFLALRTSKHPGYNPQHNQVISSRITQKYLSTAPVVAIVSIFLYWPFFSKEWMLLDDWEWLSIANGFVRQWTHEYHRVLLARWFNFLDPHNYTRVISVFTLMADIFVWKDNLAGYHLTNILIHISNSILCGILVLFLTSRPAFAFVAGITAAINPIVFMSVAEINGRGDLVCTFFGLASLICYLVSMRNTLKTGIIWYCLAFICATFALWSKEMALALPGVILCLELFFGGRRRPGLIILRLAPFVFLSVIKLSNLSGLPQEGMTLEGMVGSFKTFLIYTPHNLLLPFLPNEFSGQLRVLLLAIIVAASYGAARIRGNRLRLAVFGIMFTIAFMVPVYNFVTQSELGNSRIFYLASFGWALVIASILSPDPRNSGKISKFDLALVIGFWLILARVNLLFSSAILPQPDYSLELRTAIRGILENPPSQRIFLCGDAIDMDRAEFFMERYSSESKNDTRFFRFREPGRGKEMHLEVLGSYPRYDRGTVKYIPFSFFANCPVLWWDGVSRQYREAGSALLSAIHLSEILPENEIIHPLIENDFRWRLEDELILHQACSEELEKKLLYRILQTDPGRFPIEHDITLEWEINLGKEVLLEEKPFMIDIVIPPRVAPSERDFFILPKPIHGTKRWQGSMPLQNYLSGNAEIAGAPVIIRFWLPSDLKPVSGRMVLRRFS